jgi:phosphatidylglycerophosphate synthase
MTQDDPASGARRPLASRDTAFARRLTQLLLRTPVTPNQISVASVGFAAAGALALLAAPATPWLFLVAAAGAQLRLLCNLLDGMVAVEGGRADRLGPLFNEFPDRIADSLLIVALGYAAGFGWLGWLGALLAAFTAYIRTLGGSLGLAQDFRGPFAKPQRMALLTGACVLALIEAQLHEGGYVLAIAAAVIAIGSAATCATRLRAIAAQLAGGGV